MPYTTLKSRAKSSVVADANPNVSVPATVDIVEYDTFRPDANIPAKGWTYYLIFRDAAGAEVLSGTATVNLWVYDELDGSWASVQVSSSNENRALYQCAHFFGACKLFFQLTDIAGAGVASVEARLGSF